MILRYSSPLAVQSCQNHYVYLEELLLACCLSSFAVSGSGSVPRVQMNALAALLPNDTM